MEKRPVKPHNPNTHPPRFKLPPGACDTHLHIYGPFDRYSLVEEGGYDPDPRSTLDDYLNVHRKLGLERAVIVTGSGNGTNNRITLDAIARMQGKFKGVALLDPAISDAELRQLKDGGFTGFRIKAEGRGLFIRRHPVHDRAQHRIRLAYRIHAAVDGRGDRRRAVSEFAQSTLSDRSRGSCRTAHDERRS